jgi:cytochrome b561
MDRKKDRDNKDWKGVPGRQASKPQEEAREARRGESIVLQTEWLRTCTVHWCLLVMQLALPLSSCTPTKENKTTSLLGRIGIIVRNNRNSSSL